MKSVTHLLDEYTVLTRQKRPVIINFGGKTNIFQ
jgi:hypothetical protein